MRYSLRTFLITTALVTVVLVGLVWTFRAYHYGIDDGYAQWGIAEMLIDYMDKNDGAWPRDWEALRPSFAAGGARVGGWSFEKYKSRIWIDFDAEPIALRRLSLSSDQPGFNVIGATHDTGVYVGDDPNRLLWTYFRSDRGP